MNNHLYQLKPANSSGDYLTLKKASYIYNTNKKNTKINNKTLPHNKDKSHNSLLLYNKGSFQEIDLSGSSLWPYERASQIGSKKKLNTSTGLLTGALTLVKNASQINDYYKNKKIKVTQTTVATYGKFTAHGFTGYNFLTGTNENLTLTVDGVDNTQLLVANYTIPTTTVATASLNALFTNVAITSVLNESSYGKTWTLTIASTTISESVGVAVAQGTNGGTLKTALTGGGMVEIVITPTGTTDVFVNNAAITIGATTVAAVTITDASQSERTLLIKSNTAGQNSTVAINYAKSGPNAIALFGAADSIVDMDVASITSVDVATQLVTLVHVANTTRFFLVGEEVTLSGFTGLYATAGLNQVYKVSTITNTTTIVLKGKGLTTIASPPATGTSEKLTTSSRVNSVSGSATKIVQMRTITGYIAATKIITTDKVFSPVTAADNEYEIFLDENGTLTF
tara:strand:+ start:839 stop:2203 length:1365 start_codon:yes stop_codon:yes gene_type:complete